MAQAPKRASTPPLANVPDWPANQVEMRPLDGLLAYALNARIHSPEQVAQIVASIKEFGWTNPVIVDEQGVIIAGHGRVMAASKLAIAQVPCVVARNWTDAQKKAYRLADNQLPLNATWNIDLLKAEVLELKRQDYPLELLGFPDLDMVSFITGLEPGAGSELSDDPNRGSVLELINVTIADPTTKVEPGDHYLLQKRHHLLCTSVTAGWPAWAPLLKGEALFCPYPGVFVPFGSKAAACALIMVQPDPYIAGHILDRLVEVHGKKAVAKLPPVMVPA